jgi:molybdopterin-guanine dinucleotide biosynthesis protein A
MAVAGLLLTGGRSRRMGRDKATIQVAGQTLAERTAALLTQVASPAIEVGPGHTTLPRALDPGEGPLVAVVAGWRILTSAGWDGGVLVVATDLPALTVEMLGWLADRPGAGSVVPLDDGRAQPLCARYGDADLHVAAELVGAGHRAMGDLLARIDAARPDTGEWTAAAGRPDALIDADTPEDLAWIVPRP